MTRRTNASRRAGHLVLPAGAALMLAAVVGCSNSETEPPEPGPPPTGTSAAFAVTSADVAIAPDDEFPVNLVFVAPESDPIWGGLTGIAVPDGPQLSPGEFAVEQAAPVAGGRLGNLTFSLPVGSTALAFDEVELYLVDQEEPSIADIGTWTIAPTNVTEATVTPVGDIALTADTCGPVTATLRNETEASITAARAAVTAPGASVSATSIEHPAAPGDDFVLSFDLSCDTTADFYIVSPTITYETAEGEFTSRLDPLTIGLTAINDETIAQITARAA